MIRRLIHQSIEWLLSEQAAIALFGSRQVGKTTVTRQIAKNRDSAYFDLEVPDQDRDAAGHGRYTRDEFDLVFVHALRSHSVFPASQVKAS